MPRPADDEWDDDSFEPEEEEFDDRFDEDSDEEDDATIACPHCGRAIHEESIRCPHCEAYFSDEDAPPARKPWWIIVGTLLCLYVVYRWIAG